ncbi:hypothetical protein [Luteimonas sp. R10]|uniref:hypothetical protein n=1 Tax=Luteimonas sp. R10 TaxID=3108176 RepID=UPI00308C5A1A|nr:hypothetical protein U3649_18040 [Luteimonas sp. R10]
MKTLMKTLSSWMLLAALCAPAAHAADDPDAQRLLQRLQALDADPVQRGFAQYERLQARQAVDAYANARGDRALPLQVAEWRVETAETAARTETIRREIGELDRERSDLLVEASRQEAERARQEAERLRVQAQIQAEEAARLRMAAESESSARQEAEIMLDGVASDQAAKLRAARAREAELARREAELMRAVEEGDDD